MEGKIYIVQSLEVQSGRIPIRYFYTSPKALLWSPATESPSLSTPSPSITTYIFFLADRVVVALGSRYPVLPSKENLLGGKRAHSLQLQYLWGPSPALAEVMLSTGCSQPITETETLLVANIYSGVLRWAGWDFLGIELQLTPLPTRAPFLPSPFPFTESDMRLRLQVFSCLLLPPHHCIIYSLFPQ